MQNSYEKAQEVLGIVELREMILSNISFTDLSNARLVSKEFRDAVDASPTLGAKLFKRHDRSKKQPALYFWKNKKDDEEDSGHFNPPRNAEPAHPAECYTGLPIAKVHPAFVSYRTQAYRWTDKVEIELASVWNMLDWQSDGVWNKVVLIQPRCTQLTIRVVDGSAPNITTAIIRNKNGVTLRNVVTRLGRMVRNLQGPRRLVAPTAFRKDDGLIALSPRQRNRIRLVHGWAEGMVWEQSDSFRQAELEQEIEKAERLAAEAKEAFRKAEADTDGKWPSASMLELASKRRRLPIE